LESCRTTCTCSSNRTRPRPPCMWPTSSRVSPLGIYGRSFPSCGRSCNVVVAVVLCGQRGRVSAETVRRYIDTQYGAPVGARPGRVAREAVVQVPAAPTGKQAAALTEMLADHCSLYNAALQERRDAYRHVSKTRCATASSPRSSRTSGVRPGTAGRWSFSSQQATLRRLEQGIRRVLPPHQGRTDTRLPAGFEVSAGSTRSSSPKTATAPMGLHPARPVTASASRASGTSGSTGTARSSAP